MTQRHDDGWLSGTTEALINGHDAMLLDLDGVIYRGQCPIDHAVEAVRTATTAGVAACYVTNNSSREPSTVAEQLRGYGLNCQADDVVTSAEAAAQLLGDICPPGAAVLVVGGPGLRRDTASRLPSR